MLTHQRERGCCPLHAPLLRGHSPAGDIWCWVMATDQFPCVCKFSAHASRHIVGTGSQGVLVALQQLWLQSQPSPFQQESVHCMQPSEWAQGSCPFGALSGTEPSLGATCVGTHRERGIPTVPIKHKQPRFHAILHIHGGQAEVLPSPITPWLRQQATPTLLGGHVTPLNGPSRWAYRPHLKTHIVCAFFTAPAISAMRPPSVVHGHRDGVPVKAQFRPH